MPLYYEFPEELKAGSEVADQMAATFVKQWVAFLTKDPILMDVEDLDKAYQISQTLKGYEEKFQDIFEAYYHHRERAVTPQMLIDNALELVKTMVGYLDQKCILFLDEGQYLANRYYAEGDPEKKPERCEGVIGAVMQHPYIWLLLSGSRVSSLHYDIISGSRANKIAKRGLQPLRERDAMELVRKVVEAGGYQVYPGIEKDVYSLVGGNPYYIMTLFKRETQYTGIKEKSKSFTSPQELQEVFEFEGLDAKGEIFNFWLEHYAENEEHLNANPPHRPGLSYQLLKYLADRPGETIYFEILEEEFGLSNGELKERLYRLEEADLIRTNRFIGQAEGLKDQVLSLVIRQLEHFRKTSNTLPILEAQAIISQRLGLVESDVKDLRENVDKAHKHIRKVSGRLSNMQGRLAELTLAEKIQTGEGWFEGMEVGELNNINVSLKNGKGYQVDIYGEVGINGHSAKPSLRKGKGGRKPGKAALAVEVKERERKVNIPEARKYLEALHTLKSTKKVRHIVAIYISKGGFSGSAAKLLEDNGVYTGTQEYFGL